MILEFIPGLVMLFVWDETVVAGVGEVGCVQYGLRIKYSQVATSRPERRGGVDKPYIRIVGQSVRKLYQSERVISLVS